MKHEFHKIEILLLLTSCRKVLGKNACILPFRLSFMHPPTKKNNDQYPTMLSFQLPLMNTLRNLEFVYLKSDFAYLLFP